MSLRGNEVTEAIYLWIASELTLLAMTTIQMKLKFETPVIIGALCSQKRQIPKELFRHFGKLKPQFAFLPFQVEKKYLKNTLECMKLMDIHALLVCGPHRRNILGHLKVVDPAARDAGAIDIIVRKGKTFVGKCIQLDCSTRLGNDKMRKMGHFCQIAAELLTAGKKSK